MQSGTPLLEALEPKNVHPYIVMSGSTSKQITRYYIVVDGKIINVIFCFIFW